MIAGWPTIVRQALRRCMPSRYHAARHGRPSRKRIPHRPFARGFTLVELMIVLTVISIMATMCIPTFQRAVEQSRADIAAANLRAIWAAERLYWLEYRTYTDQFTALRGMGALDPSFPVVGNYGYTLNSDGSTFSATAATNSGAEATITIDQNGTIICTGVTLGVQFQ